jgi:hypothetical protein
MNIELLQFYYSDDFIWDLESKRTPSSMLRNDSVGALTSLGKRSTTPSGATHLSRNASWRNPPTKVAPGQLLARVPCVRSVKTADFV